MNQLVPGDNLLDLGSLKEPGSILWPTRGRCVQQARHAMLEDQKTLPAKIAGLSREPQTDRDLPSPKTSHWVIRRKAEVVAAVRKGLLTIPEVCERYNLTIEEFGSWERAIEREGVLGLRAKRIQHYRNHEFRDSGNSHRDGG